MSYSINCLLLNLDRLLHLEAKRSLFKKIKANQHLKLKLKMQISFNQLVKNRLQPFIVRTVSSFAGLGNSYKDSAVLEVLYLQSHLFSAIKRLQQFELLHSTIRS
jgi:hypothetical protein